VSDLNGTSSLAWHPGEREVWYVAVAEEGQSFGIMYAAGLDGRSRPTYHTLGSLRLMDFNAHGEALVVRQNPRLRMQTGIRAGERRELSLFDWTLARDISRDGSQVLFDESGSGARNTITTYVRGTDGSPAVRIAAGAAMGFMPDGRHVLVVERSSGLLAIYPLGVGEPHTVDTGSLTCHFARPLPDGRSVAVIGNRPGEPVRLYRVEIASGSVTTIGEEPVAFSHVQVSPSGDQITVRQADGTSAIVSAMDGARTVLPLEPDWRPAAWGADDRTLFLYRRGAIPGGIQRLDLETGRREPWVTLEPTARHGAQGFLAAAMTPDGERYVASYMQFITDLYAVRGLD